MRRKLTRKGYNVVVVYVTREGKKESAHWILTGEPTIGWLYDSIADASIITHICITPIRMSIPWTKFVSYWLEEMAFDYKETLSTYEIMKEMKGSKNYEL